MKVRWFSHRQITDHIHPTDDHYHYLPLEMLPLAQSSFSKGEIKTRHRITPGTDRRMTSMVLQAILQLTQPYCLKQHDHIYAQLFHPILYNCLLVLLCEGSWSQIELAAFPCFSPFLSLTARHFSFFSSLPDLYHYRRYFSPISCSRQIPFASKCIPPA